MITRLSFTGIILLVFLQKTFAQVNSKITQNVDPVTGFLEINNGLCGIIVPWKKAELNKTYNFAPIQSVIYLDGQHSDNTVNYLITSIKPSSFKTSILVNTPAEFKVLLDYRFNKPEFVFVGQRFPGGDSGPGYYKVTLSVKKNRKSITILEETDFDISYYLKISRGLNADQARYRGWNSSSLKNGYEPGGIIYRSENERPYPMDATVDLNYTVPYFFPKLSLWDQAGGEQSTGRYWQLYNSKLNKSNLFGLFQGKPSLLIGAQISGPQLYLSPIDEISKDPNCAELYVSITRRTADNTWFPKKRYQWNIYISSSDEVLSPEQYQPIAKEMNFNSGLGATIVSKGSKRPILNPSFYECAIYLSPKEIQKIISKLKTEDQYYYKLLGIEGDYRDLWNIWKFRDSVRPILNRLLAMRQRLILNYISEDGTFSKSTRYWIGVRNFKINAFTIAGIFADKSIHITANEKKELELLMGLMARILWDDDNVPVQENAGVNMGPANMVHQYINNGRIFFALLMSNDLEFSQRALKAVSDVKLEIDQVIFKNGSSFGSPHYTQVAVDPILFTLLQIREAGLGDQFLNPNIKKYAMFLTSLLTPASCRFDGYRKLISFGDGSEESCGTFGLLATGYQKSDIHFSDELIRLYFNGPPNYIFAGPAPLAITSKYLPQTSTVNFTDCSYDGYHSLFRAGANTILESALWVLNGEKFYDHRNDDRGEVAIYSLGAPLSLSRSSFYSPHVPGSKIRSMVIASKNFPDWADNEQKIFDHMDYGAAWAKSKQIEFASLKHAAFTNIKMTNPDSTLWFRAIMEIKVNDSLPVYVFYDSVTISSIWSMMMMSDGPVLTPYGPITPEKRIHNNADLKQLPSGTTAKQMNKGWNTFEFTGQTWRIHPYGGINWSVQSCSATNDSFSLADWGTTWQTTNESNDYKKTNLSDYKEEQQILRIKMNSPLMNIIIPYLKGQKTPFQIISKSLNYIKYQIQNKTLEIYPMAYHLASEDMHTMAWFGTPSDLTLNNISVQGGSIEIEQKDKNISCYLNGSSGTRTIIFPFKVNSITSNNDVFIKPLGQGTRVMINFRSPGLNQPIGTVHYAEFKFVQS